MAQLKLRKTGNTLSTTWPKELLSRRNVKEGTGVRDWTWHSVTVPPYGPRFERTMQNADKVIERCKHPYKVLADR